MRTANVTDKSDNDILRFETDIWNTWPTGRMTLWSLESSSNCFRQLPEGTLFSNWANTILYYFPEPATNLKCMLITLL